MLHTISHSLIEIDTTALFALIGKNDVILLLQNGVTAAILHSDHWQQLKRLTNPIYVLSEDVKARGLLAFLAPKIILIDYMQFVQLTTEHFPQTAW